MGKGCERKKKVRKAGTEGQLSLASLYSVLPELTGLGHTAAYVHLKAQMACLPIMSRATPWKLKVILFFPDIL